MKSSNLSSFRKLILGLTVLVVLCIIGLIIYTSTLLHRHGIRGAAVSDFSTSISNNEMTLLLEGLVNIYSTLFALLLVLLGVAWYGRKKGLFDSFAQLQLAAAFKQSEQNYRELVDKAHTIILKMDCDGRITFFNAYAQAFFGFSEQELLGKNVVGTIVPETDSSGRDLKKMIAQLMENPSSLAYSLNENIRKNGERVWVSWGNHKLLDAEGGYRGILSVGQDMTERKQMEEAIRANELRFRSFIETVNDVIFVLTPSGTFSYVSPQWQKCFGYELSEVIGKPFAPFVHPDDVPGCINFLTDVLQSGEQKRGVEYRVLHKNGTWLWYTANGSRLVDPNGSVSLVGIGRDITEYKLIQKELMKTQKLESISFLAAGIAHNFNNVLTGVIGYISFARKHLNDPDKIAPLLEDAEKSSYRAASLARQLLTFSKGGVPYKTLVAPEKLVQESMSLFLSGSKIKGIVDNKSSQTVNVDSEQINQSFNNIILNSVHSMPQGGVITAHIEDLQLEKENRYLLKCGEYVRITFEDCGCGIEEEHLHKVFDPYFTTKPDGSGLGLSTTQSILAKHGGYIDIVSEVNFGTTVTVMLPSSQNAPADDVIETESPGPSPAGVSVLIMDDEEYIRTLVSEMLGDFGYQVQTCSNGEEAVELYKKCWNTGIVLPVVVLDLLVPGGMGGCEAAKRILSVDPHARLIVSSGYSHDPIMADYKEYGFSATLSKPYNTDSMVQVIQSVQ
jgi:PAS domain S-box-containing protein